MAMPAACSWPALAFCSAALAIWLVAKLVNHYKGMPVLSQFTLYLIGVVAAGALACVDW